MLYFIYELIDPRDNRPFYVGITNNPNARMMTHLAATESNTEKNARINAIRSSGLQPTMRIIEYWDKKDKAEEREIYWITCYGKQGLPLTNMTFVKVPKLPTKPRPKGKKEVQSATNWYHPTPDPQPSPPPRDDKYSYRRYRLRVGSDGQG
jgi:predicted GIY-YIG superfamily endonuclease